MAADARRRTEDLAGADAFAQRVSNAMAILRLFACGFSLARDAGGRPLVVAMEFTAFGVAVAAAALALGG